LRAADWTTTMGLLKRVEPALPYLKFLARELEQFAVGMQALEQHDVAGAEMASKEFDAELWRTSDRVKDEEDIKAKEKKTDDKVPEKVKLMPDALPDPLVKNLSIMSLELRAGLLV
jgi:hypothetical protein